MLSPCCVGCGKGQNKYKVHNQPQKQAATTQQQQQVKVIATPSVATFALPARASNILSSRQHVAKDHIRAHRLLWIFTVYG